MQIENVRGVKAHIRYRLKDGTPVPGATTVLGVLNKPALVKWANNLGLQGIDSSKYVNKMAVIGTLAHYMLECYLRQEKPDLSSFSPEEVSKAENSLLSFFEWEKNHSLEPQLCEVPLVSEKYRYGGTIDYYGLLNGVITLLDFKTGGGIYAEYVYQVAAYKQLLEENGYPVEQARILQIGRDETEGFSEKVITEFEKPWQVFWHCLQIYRLQKGVA